MKEGVVTSPVEEGVAAATVEERRGRRREMVGARGGGVGGREERGKGQIEGVEADADLSCEVHGI